VFDSNRLRAAGEPFNTSDLFLMNTDGTISRDVMPDLLHLSEKGYRQWARAIAPTLERLISLP